MKKRFPQKKNILLVNITRLGDMLQATPTIAGLKQENPDCHITVIVEKQFDAVCRSLPYIDEVISIDLGMTVRALARERDGIIDAYEYVSDFIEKLRARKYDFCLNMSSSAYTALLINLVEIENCGGWTADEEGYRVINSEWAKLFASSVYHTNRLYNSLNLVDVFRCSADVEQHPNRLLFNVDPTCLEYVDKMISDAGFTAKGPLICLQAGASQPKRQWATEHFIALVKQLRTELDARIVLTGTNKELHIIEPIKNGANSENVFIAAGKTNIPQLGALLKRSNLLITGDTGTMHISVSVGTPVVSMFLASAFGSETGPYSEGNIVLQPVIGCGPCNPNKGCAKTDCHDTIEPKLVAQLTAMRLKEDFKSIPVGLADPNKVIVYRTCFDPFGFYDMQALNVQSADGLMRLRTAYRKLWLDDLAGYDVSIIKNMPKNPLAQVDHQLLGLDKVANLAQKGMDLIGSLKRLISDTQAPALQLKEVSTELTSIDHEIERIGYDNPPLGLITRMFVFGKENISGSDANDLASQMGRVYEDLVRRSQKLEAYYNN